MGVKNEETWSECSSTKVSIPSTIYPLRRKLLPAATATQGVPGKEIEVKQRGTGQVIRGLDVRLGEPLTPRTGITFDPVSARKPKSRKSFLPTVCFPRCRSVDIRHADAEFPTRRAMIGSILPRSGSDSPHVNRSQLPPARL